MAVTDNDTCLAGRYWLGITTCERIELTWYEGLYWRLRWTK